ncbi:MAG: ABC transporter substrate-binding protein [Candidatus Tenebribacter burtonii]|jgi:multiple sugar transport system substrate-binding protein|nr:ABC transporter substrate-binding protein [Candidatus Tenebribacter burtonii]
MKKIAILLIVLSMMIIACGKKEIANSEVTEILFWQAMGGPLGDALEELVQKFNDTHLDIHVNSVNMGNYTALSQKLMASFQTGNQPDVAQAYEAWIANMLEGDVIVPIEEFIDNDPDFGDEDMADIYPVFINSNTMKGKIVSFPFNKSVRVQYYNKDILFKNDMDENKPPKTWEEFRTYCQKLTQDTDGDGKIDQYGTTIKISAWQFENLLLQAGGKIMNEDNTKPMFNSKEGVQALEFFTNILNKDETGYLSPGYDGQKDFTAQKVAFYEDSSVSMAFMLRTGINFNMGISAIPIKKTKKNIISGTNVVIFKNNEDKKKEQAAWEFVKWFTDTEQTARWSELTYYMPVRKSAMKVEALKNRISNNPEIASVYDQLNYATFEPQISEWFETRKYLEEHVIEKVVRGMLSPEQALDNAAEMIKKKIAKREN